MPTRGLSDGPAFVRLGADECWQLLASRSFGRISFCVDHRVEVVLTAYVIRSDSIFFRAAAFGPVARQAQTRPVTLQIDDMHDDQQATWSVKVTGSAHRVDDAATLASLWTPVRPQSWESGVEPLWIGLTPQDVQGKRGRP
jgi:uncharacterized protein